MRSGARRPGQPLPPAAMSLLHAMGLSRGAKVPPGRQGSHLTRLCFRGIPHPQLGDKSGGEGSGQGEQQPQKGDLGF